MTLDRTDFFGNAADKTSRAHASNPACGKRGLTEALLCSRRPFCRLWLFLAVAILFGSLSAAQALGQAYTSIVVFGDSLSDTGNDAYVSAAKYTVNAQVPGPATGYTNGRFTDGLDSSPAARGYTGVWVEQLAAKLAAHPAVANSLSGGTNYAYGFATTDVGTSTFAYGPANVFSFQVNNLGQQISDYLATHPVITSKTLFVVWGGANDLINATSSADIANAATRDIALVQRLINAGATDIVVPNLPPLGLVPRFNGSAATSAPATAAAAGFDQALAAGFNNLAVTNAGKPLNLFFLDIYTLFNTIVGPPVLPGFANITASSQGNTSINPDTYLFWDDLHPTTFGHSLIASAALTLLGPPVRTTSVLTSSGTTINLKSSLTLTATVTSTTGTPIGNVTFLDAGSPIGSALLSGTSTSATATLTTSSLSAGPHPISASYMGVNGYTGSVSSVVNELVVAPSFAAGASPSSLTIARGGSGSATLTITPAGGYTGSFAVLCGTLPAHFSCTVASPSLTIAGGAAVSTAVQIGTNAVTSKAMPGVQGGSGIAWALLGLPLLCGLGWRTSRRGGRQLLPAILCVALSAGMALGLTGCGGDPYANDVAPGSYQIPILVTPAGGTASTLTIPVTVQ